MEVPARQVNFRGSLPRSASNVLEPMLHPVSPMGKSHEKICNYFVKFDTYISQCAYKDKR